MWKYFLFFYKNKKYFYYCRKFNILNPTAENMFYKWIPIETNPNNTFYFNCLNLSGTLYRGSTTEAVFTFTPRVFGTFETFYTFELPQHNLSTKFLLHAIARKPKVYFDRPYLNLKPSVLGVEVNDEICLRNDDPISCKFRILKESLVSPGKSHVLNVEPMAGELEPFSSTVIR